MLFEVDTDLKGIAILLRAMVELNIHDARRDEAHARELVRRCSAQTGGFLYRRDPVRRDTWSTFVPLLARSKSASPIPSDCEDQTGAYGAGITLLEPWREVEVAITQPEPGAMAHAYLFVDGQVFDPSAVNGMRRPDPSFYTGGETARLPILAR